jgi:SAM-dependent methyltransferase
VKRRLLDLIVCPACEGALHLEGDEPLEVQDGWLRCSRCSARYPIRNSIPRLVRSGLSAQQAKTARAFGWQWQHFHELHRQYEQQFLDWIAPIQPEFFAGKLVLDAGCGIGRHAYFAARYGAREVIAMDLSDAVESAQRNLGALPNVHVLQADIYDPPFRRAAMGGDFDFIYSIGVLHHLPDPEAGMRSLLRVLRPGGTFFGWVYGYENNALVRRAIDPFRRGVTSRLPPPVLQAIAFPLALLFHAAVKGVYRPLAKSALGRRLPAGAYLSSLGSFSLRQNYNIVFDQLVAPTAVYLRREEFASWFQRAGLQEVELSWRNQNSWRGRGRVPQHQAG